VHAGAIPIVGMDSFLVIISAIGAGIASITIANDAGLFQLLRFVYYPIGRRRSKPLP
jgi:hypothetical protein